MQQMRDRNKIVSDVRFMERTASDIENAWFNGPALRQKFVEAAERVAEDFHVKDLLYALLPIQEIIDAEDTREANKVTAQYAREIAGYFSMLK